MPYRFTDDDKTVQEGVRRIALEQIERALGELDDSGLDMPKTVHQVRKRCKKIRGLIRLVRPAFDRYGTENAAFRDAARALSGLRDVGALIETYDDLMDTFGERIERAAFAPVRRRLTLRQKEASEADDTNRRLSAFRERMQEARVRAAGWRVDEDGFEAVGGGLRKTFKRARKARKKAYKDSSTETFHEWRKRVKYHWYHARLLRPIWPGPVEAHENAADRLGDLLGDHHDLAVFARTVAEDPDAFGKQPDLDVLSGLIRQRQKAFEERSFFLGGKLLAEPAAALTQRWKVYWTLWRRAVGQAAS